MRHSFRLETYVDDGELGLLRLDACYSPWHQVELRDVGVWDLTAVELEELVAFINLFTHSIVKRLDISPDAVVEDVPPG